MFSEFPLFWMLDLNKVVIHCCTNEFLFFFKRLGSVQLLSWLGNISICKPQDKGIQTNHNVMNSQQNFSIWFHECRGIRYNYRYFFFFSFFSTSNLSMEQWSRKPEVAMVSILKWISRNKHKTLNTLCPVQDTFTHKKEPISCWKPQFYFIIPVYAFGNKKKMRT